MHGLKDDFELFCNLFLSGNIPYGNALDHMIKFWKHRKESNILYLKYEDMKRDLATTIRKCADFIGCTKELCDLDIEKMLQHLNFKNMQKNPAVNLSTVLPSSDAKNAKFIRRGEVGDWKNYFTPELSAKFDRVIEEKTRGTGLVFDYE